MIEITSCNIYLYGAGMPPLKKPVIIHKKSLTMKRKILQFIFTTLTLGIIYFTNVSYSTGPDLNTPVTGCTCHGAANANTSVIINFNNGGPLVYNNGQTYPLVITVNSLANKPGAGFAMSYNIGTLSPVTPGTTVGSGVWRQNTPRAMSGANPSTTSWVANWTAPANGSTVLQFKAAGNAVSLSNGNLLDHWFFAPTVNVPLPVFFESLHVYDAGAFNQIVWEVISEKNISFYEIQKSSNGVDFKSMETIPAINTEEKHRYEWLDPSNVGSAVVYYRILASDVDGKESYSVTESLKKNTSLGGNRLYPNIVDANSPVKILLNAVQAGDQILVTNWLGQIISQKAATAGTSEMNTAGLSAGMYFVILQSQQQRSLIDRLMIR